MPVNNVINRADTAGIIPVEYSTELLGNVAEQSAVMRLARRLRNMAVGETKLPVISALSSAYFVAEGGLIQTNEVNWNDTTITAEELAVIVPVPNNVLDDASIDLWAEVRPDVETAFGAAIDAAVIYGTNAPASWPTAITTAAVAAGNTVTIGTGVDLYADTLGVNGHIGKLEADGYMATAHLAHLTMRGKLRDVRDSDGNLIFLPSMQAGGNYTLDGAPILFPMNGSMSTTYPLISGQWDQLVYSMRRDLSWEISNQAVISDAQGKVVINLFQQNMTAMKFVMRLGFAVPNPINRINQTGATRYPFSVLAA